MINEGSVFIIDDWKQWQSRTTISFLAWTAVFTHFEILPFWKNVWLKQWILAGFSSGEELGRYFLYSPIDAFISYSRPFGFKKCISQDAESGGNHIVQYALVKLPCIIWLYAGFFKRIRESYSPLGRYNTLVKQILLLKESQQVRVL